MPKNVSKHTQIDVAFEARHPLHVKLLRFDPPPAVKLTVFRIEINVPVFTKETAQVIHLLLSSVDPVLETPLGKIVTVAPFAVEELDVFWSDSHLLLHFAEESFLQAFPGVHPSLRELPGAPESGTLRHEHGVVHVENDGRHVRAVDHRRHDFHLGRRHNTASLGLRLTCRMDIWKRRSHLWVP